MHERGGSRLSPAHGFSPANEVFAADRVSTPRSGDVQARVPSQVQSQAQPEPIIQRAARPTGTPPVQPEPVKPASEKSVMFDLQPQEFEFTPEGERAPDLEGERERDGGRRKDRDKEREGDRDGGRERERDRDRNRERKRRDESPASEASDDTIELPPRFDGQGRERGRERDEDPLARQLESVLNGLFR